MFLNRIRNNFFLRLTLLFFLSLLLNPISFAATSTHHKQSTHHTKKKVYKKKSTKKKKVVHTQSSLNFDQQYTRFLHRWQIPGSSVAIIKHNKFILSRGYGWADSANHRAVTPDSVFRIASVSKAITAVSTLKLIQDGKLSLDRSVFKILSDLQPLTDAKPSPKLSTITVRNLLEMSSGWVTDQGVDPMLGAWSSKMLNQLNYHIPPDCRTAARMMMTIPMQYKPGTRYSYSNINYCMLGLVINKVTGNAGPSGYEQYIKKQLLTPYGITTMRIGNNGQGKQLPNEVHYYLLDHSYDEGRIHDGLPYGPTNLLQKNFSDGGWVASAPDLAKFFNALGQHKILTPKMMSIMTARPASTNIKDNFFAKGFKVTHFNGHQFIIKTGSFTGTQALVMLDDTGTAYAALFNAKPSNRKVFLSELQSMLIAYARAK